MGCTLLKEACKDAGFFQWFNYCSLGDKNNYPMINPYIQEIFWEWKSKCYIKVVRSLVINKLYHSDFYPAIQREKTQI